MITEPEGAGAGKKQDRQEPSQSSQTGTPGLQDHAAIRQGSRSSALRPTTDSGAANSGVRRLAKFLPRYKEELFSFTADRKRQDALKVLGGIVAGFAPAHYYSPVRFGKRLILEPEQLSNLPEMRVGRFGSAKILGPQEGDLRADNLLMMPYDKTAVRGRGGRMYGYSHGVLVPVILGDRIRGILLKAYSGEKITRGERSTVLRYLIERMEFYSRHFHHLRKYV